MHAHCVFCMLAHRGKKKKLKLKNNNNKTNRTVPITDHFAMINKIWGFFCFCLFVVLFFLVQKRDLLRL